ncbi:hypothetical protein LPJ73_006019, partial [Coemansia sp. RSA 2703]
MTVPTETTRDTTAASPAKILADTNPAETHKDAEANTDAGLNTDAEPSKDSEAPNEAEPKKDAEPTPSTEHSTQHQPDTAPIKKQYLLPVSAEPKAETPSDPAPRGQHKNRRQQNKN